MIQGVNGAELKVPSDAVKGWEMLQLCWQCREGSQFFFPPPIMFLAAGAALIPSELERGCGTAQLPWGPCPSQSPMDHCVRVPLWASPAQSLVLLVTPGLWLCLGNACGQQERGCAAAQAFKAVSDVETEQ